jgi:hypothetical protein
MGWIEQLSSVPTKPLYHYTSIEGLLGIFKERKMWATSIFHLNDQEELRQAMDMFRYALRELEERIGLKRRAVAIEGTVDDPRVICLDHLDLLFNLTEELGVFVCSFSEAEDLLSQWRGYCTGECGFSIGFDYTPLKAQLDRQDFVLAKCIYDRDKQKETIDEYIRKNIETELQNVIKAKDNKDDHLKEKATDMYLEIIQVLPILKNDCFQEEQEWRLVSPLVIYGKNKKVKIKFRSGKTAVIPYCDFELENKQGEGLPINSIIIGPTPNRTESYMGVKTILTEENMLGRTDVRHSKIPYREI